MKITKITHHTTDELIKHLREVTLMKQPDQRIYKDVFISLEQMSIESITPAQRYVLADELNKVRDLKWAIEEHGYNIFKLEGYLSVWLEGEEEPIDLLPAVVEESIEADGKVISILNDGMHRTYLARLEWQTPQVIHVRGVPKEKPYYAFPIHEGWDKVEIVNELPPGYIKKWHRIKEYKTLYRDFNSAFKNVGGPRGHFVKKK
ncbi:MAG: hypothetical protein HQK84_07290 [Nitrospinae bacterium]|nr:hypothetical protein [Nitrospinota bacterium]